MTFEQLNKKRFDKYGAFSNKAIRAHRAITWGMAAEKATDIDEKFIFYWISLNAAYSDANMTDESERTKRQVFFEKIVDLDVESSLPKALVGIQNQLRLFVDNQYLYKEFWEAQSGESSEEFFEKTRTKYMKKIYSGLMKKDDEVDCLDYTFNLMALLRNQIFHGLATYKSQANRDQVEAGVTILQLVMPIIAELLLEHDEVDWGEISYPYINKDK